MSYKYKLEDFELVKGESIIYVKLKAYKNKEENYCGVGDRTGGGVNSCKSCEIHSVMFTEDMIEEYENKEYSGCAIKYSKHIEERMTKHKIDAILE
jgi:hypothetical protein